ncbi:MAG TPA: hypothetical protein DCF68_15460 [Cyanothece sp. UBA12306]|nr:hypothetical protein [Cyanothece sp. UBA12306]
MIHLTLLHPNKPEPVQNWTFDQKSTIRIGRSDENEVVLFSAVVSRHHLEIRWDGTYWEVISLGTNGTYVEGKLIKRKPVIDGMIIHLAATGPKIQIHISEEKSSDESELSQDSVSVSNQEVDSSKITAQETRV